ncbi:MAG: vWA domain-containing protein [Pirellulales bacterium]
MTESVQYRITSSLIESFTEWWQLPVLFVMVSGLIVFTLWMIRCDAADVSWGITLILAVLRLGAVFALVVAYLDLERRTEHELVSPSRVAVLIDSSASMTLSANGSEDNASDQIQKSRTGSAIDVLNEEGLLGALSARHEVSIWRFDADAEPLAVEPVQKKNITSRGANPSSQPPSGSMKNVDKKGGSNWQTQISPRGFETRLGEALSRVESEEPSNVLSGIILLSDGATNAGIDPMAAAAPLKKAGVPVFPIGVGSEKLPSNVRVSDLVAPARVFPGDQFSVTGYLQSQGLAGQTVRVELVEATADNSDGDNQLSRVIDSKELRLGGDGDVLAARFDVPGLDATGRRLLALRLQPPTGDQTASDNQQTAEIEVVDRVTQVLLMAGGPSREYQFMRNVLDRDASFAVDVILGTASEGVSQDARKILSAFPGTAEAIDSYDVVVAFDYDWRKLDAPAQSRLERWVSRESGGLVFVAGSIFMNSWISSPETAVIRDLHPVELEESLSLAIGESLVRSEPMPLSFTRDGQDAEFLWLAGSRIANQTLWNDLPGVFSCFDANAAKPGATVYARPESPAGGLVELAPIFMAGQFYGSGSVFYLGSGELWRLRAIEDAVYERIITQLVRHVSQGRLLRGSRKLRLLVDRDRFAVGATVGVRVVVPEGDDLAGNVKAICTVTGPDGQPLQVQMNDDPQRPGSLSGGFVASKEGAWRIDVDLHGERVTKRIQARLPDRELQKPQLNRSSLEQIAIATGGFPRFLIDKEWSQKDTVKLTESLADRSRKEYEMGAPDTQFKRRLNAILMSLGIGLLCLGWIIRRLVRLA